MRDFVREVGLPIFVTGGILGVGICALMIVATALEAYQCAKYEKVTGRPTSYEGLSCYVKDGGQWYIWAEYKHHLAAKRGVKQ